MQQVKETNPKDQKKKSFPWYLEFGICDLHRIAPSFNASLYFRDGEG